MTRRSRHSAAYDLTKWLCTGAALAAGLTSVQGVTSASECDDIFSPVFAIQGNAASSQFAGTQVETLAVVTADFRGGSDGLGELSGFYVEDAVGDGDPSSSDGLFVYTEPGSAVADPASFPLHPGVRLRIAGTIQEFDAETQLKAEGAQVCGDSVLRPPPTVELPFARSVLDDEHGYIADMERFEGMRIFVSGPLVVSSVGDLIRYGEVQLVQAPVPLAYTEAFLPEEQGFEGYEQAVARRSLLLDDGEWKVFQDLALGRRTLRVGDVWGDVLGVVRQGRPAFAEGASGYRLEPLASSSLPDSEPALLPSPLPVADSWLRVVGLNLHNLFKDGGRSGACYPTFTAEDCRGADEEADRVEHFARVVSGIHALSPDVIVASEVENDFGSSTSTWQQLIEDLNRAANESGSCGTYAIVDPAQYLGADAIAVALAYCAQRLELVGGPWWPTSDVLMEWGSQAAAAYYGSAASRVPLAATWRESETGETFTVVANHLKSKSSGGLEESVCAAVEPAPDCDQGDGQGHYNHSRVLAAQTLASWVRSALPQGSPILLVGDFNAYTYEDPLTILEDYGFVLLTRQLPAADYTYAYQGRVGVLDHALVDAESLERIAQVQIWPVNAGLIPSAPLVFSDHNPVLVDLMLSERSGCDCNSPTAIRGTPAADILIGTPGADTLCGFGGNDVILGLGGQDCLSGGLGDDWLLVDGSGARVYGGPGRDVLHVDESSIASSCSLVGQAIELCASSACAKSE